MTAIHFECAACGKHLEVDEVGVGMVVYCTDCGKPLKVPEKTARAVCPHCHVPVLVAENLWEQSIECSTCRRPFLAPRPDASSAPVLCIHFKCPACGKHLEVDKQGAGLIVHCTDCDAPLKVPHATARFVCPFCHVPVLVAENLWGQAIECSTCGQQIFVQDPHAPIQHACPYCYMVVIADSSQKGRFIECPTCHRQFRVPNPNLDVEQERPPPEALF